MSLHTFERDLPDLIGRTERQFGAQTDHLTEGFGDIDPKGIPLLPPALTQPYWLLDELPLRRTAGVHDPGTREFGLLSKASFGVVVESFSACFEILLSELGRRAGPSFDEERRMERLPSQGSIDPEASAVSPAASGR